MSELTPKESAALRARIVAGADGLPPRRHTASRVVAISSAVVVVGALSIGVIALGFGLGRTTDAVATPSPTPSATGSATPTTSPTPPPTLTPTPTPTPVATPTPEPVTLENGQDLITDEEWELLSARGWGFYYMQPIQRYIAVDPTADLPAEVTADIQARIDAIPNNTTAESDQTTSLMATNELVMQVAANSRKGMVVLRYNPFSVPGEPNGTGIRWYAQASQPGWSLPLSKSRDQLLADVNAWIAANAEPGTWDVFVGPGEPIIP